MTDQELLNFLEWLRSRWLIASIENRPNVRDGGVYRALKVESIANQALIDQYRRRPENS